MEPAPRHSPLWSTSYVLTAALRQFQRGAQHSAKVRRDEREWEARQRVVERDEKRRGEERPYEVAHRPALN
jgi:hypothetical protein